jgi:hypothetical protein
LKLSQEKLAFEEVNLRAAPEGFESVEWVRDLILTPEDNEAWPRLGVSIRAPGSLATNLAMAVEPENLEEIRSLAARCLLALGDAEPIVVSFGEDEFEKFWPLHLAELHSAVSRGGASAERVYVAFAQKHGPGNGDKLFRLVQGFSAEEVGDEPLTAGPVFELLLPMIESGALADRVLAKLALVESTNVAAAEEFDPSRSPRLQRKALALIRRQLSPTR